MQQDLEQDADTLFGSTVADLRKTQEMSQREFADRLRSGGLNVDASAVSRIENGSRSVRISEATIIADALDVELMSLFRYSWTPKRILRSARRATDSALHETQEDIAELMTRLNYIHELLSDNPELLEMIGDEGQRPPKSADDYFNWVRRRLEKWEDDAEEAVLFKSTHLRAEAVAIITQLAEGVSSTVDGKLIIRMNEDDDGVDN